MKCYFDTSIYNQILDDPNKDLIIAEIRKRDIVTIPSALNLCEILSTSNDDRKSLLIGIYDEIRDDYFPLKPYTWLLGEIVEAVENNIVNYEVNYHIEIDNETEEICKKLTQNKEEELEEYIQGAREYVQEKVKEIEIIDEDSYFAYIDGGNEIDFQVRLFNDLCQALKVEHNLIRDQIMVLIQHTQFPWKYFLDAYLYIFYRRPFRTEGYGSRSNPGVADLEHCVYLFWADIFVLRDSSFYDFLIELNDIRDYNKKILNYAEFKDYLGLS